MSMVIHCKSVVNHSQLLTYTNLTLNENLGQISIIFTFLKFRVHIKPRMVMTVFACLMARDYTPNVKEMSSVEPLKNHE
ncbi:unnamed protein product [Brugia pahangi]|uniref:Ovule protein n=1 Tax=Brugia pahangi TaxID=6280 RepID=A0A0N4TN91_BRUPA|nr:unnamed protein product [Brugia pahangi]